MINGYYVRNDNNGMEIFVGEDADLALLFFSTLIKSFVGDYSLPDECYAKAKNKEGIRIGYFVFYYRD